MAIKPIETEEEELYDESSHSSHVFKSFMLGGIILMGMIFGFFYNQNKHEITKEMYKAGIRPTAKPTMLPFKPVAAYNPDVDSTIDEIRDESTKMVNTSVSQVIGAGTDVLGSATENVTKSVQNTAAGSTEVVSNTLYKSTIGQVILQLFNQLPPAAKKDVANELIKQLSPTPSKKPLPTLEP